MFSSISSQHPLFLRVVFFTAKSARQTTPNLIKNPKLTPRGIMTKTHKSYAYEVPSTQANAHLFWDNTKQNKNRRKQYKQHRLYKLGIPPVHSQTGSPLNNRDLPNILNELSNLRLLKLSLGRTFANLKEVQERFNKSMSNDDRRIVYWALQQLQKRNLPSFSPYEFTTYCVLRRRFGLKASPTILVHTYKWVKSQAESPSNKFKPELLLSIVQYVFQRDYPAQLNDILMKKEIAFKLFEDVQPENHPISQYLPKIFSEEQIKSIQTGADFRTEKYAFLQRVPGGSQLFHRLTKQ